MKKGFTLIELLAVIVILAIIALIATPIILGIINDAKEESQERSIELYASAIRNGIAAHQLRTGEEVLPGNYKSSDLDFVDYDGDVECDTIELYEDGDVYVAGCTVNGTAVEYTYGTKQVTQIYKPQYYYFGFDWSGTVGTTAAPVESERLTVPPTGEIRYLGYDVTEGVVSSAYACFVKNETEYCLKGYDTEAYESNNTVLSDAFKDVENACSFDVGYSGCSADGLTADMTSSGLADARDVNAECFVLDSGNFECYSLGL